MHQHPVFGRLVGPGDRILGSSTVTQRVIGAHTAGRRNGAVFTERCGVGSCNRQVISATDCDYQSRRGGVTVFVADGVLECLRERLAGSQLLHCRQVVIERVAVASVSTQDHGAITRGLCTPCDSVLGGSSVAQCIVVFDVARDGGRTVFGNVCAIVDRNRCGVGRSDINHAGHVGVTGKVVVHTQA